MSEQNYAEKTGENTIAIHCDSQIAELVYEGICKTHAEYPDNGCDAWKYEKRNLAKLKIQIENILTKNEQQ